MPIFVCEKCGVLENTALGFYWGARSYQKDHFCNELKPYAGKVMCSECARVVPSPSGVCVVPGQWHGKFDKEYPDKKRLYWLRKEHKIIN